MTPSATMIPSASRSRGWLLGIGLTVLCAAGTLPAVPAEAAGVTRPANLAPSARTTCPPRWPYIVLTCMA